MERGDAAHSFIDKQAADFQLKDFLVVNYSSFSEMWQSFQLTLFNSQIDFWTSIDLF